MFEVFFVLDETITPPISSVSKLPSLLLVIGLSSFPWLARESVPVSSDTTTQIHLSKRSVIPRAARCLVP